MTLRAALAVSITRLPQIAGWSLLATGVGVVLQQLAERVPFGGRVAGWIAGAAWGSESVVMVEVLPDPRNTRS